MTTTARRRGAPTKLRPEHIAALSVGSITLHDIMRTVGCSYQSAVKYAKGFDNVVRKSCPHSLDPRWLEVDWAANDAQIARQIGVTREAVRQARIRRGAPDSPVKHWRQVSINRAAEIDHDAPPQTVKELAESWGIAVTNVYTTARRLGVEYKRSPGNLWKYPWEEMNWDLPSRDLALLWIGKLTFSSRVCIATNRRRFGYPARWDAHNRNLTDDPAYVAALEAERRKVAAFNLEDL